MAGRSSSADSGNTHSVFLSHSGVQKDFVEQLCVDLESSNRSVFFDIRSDSLPKGLPFPQQIFKAIQQCQVGVLVLSEEFFCSKWPMLELVQMFKTKRLSNRGMRIMPIFLSISPAGCQDEMNQRRWLSLWHEWAQQDNRINMQEWEEALKLLSSTNGFEYKVGLREVKFRKEIVKEICKVVFPAIIWDDSHVQGKSRLCKMIQDKLDMTQPCDRVQVLGIYGVGGIGKTTLCKCLCKNFYTNFGGRVCHIELKESKHSKEGRKEVLQEVLKRLTNTSEKTLRGCDEGECYLLLKEKIKKERIFMAIDNVFDSSSCLEEANAYLRLNYAHDSVVIVTARSVDQLRMLKIEEKHCIEMPELKEDEAMSLFKYHATQASQFENARTLVEGDEEIMNYCIKRCYFWRGFENMYHYHPLALEALGKQFGYTSKSWSVLLDELDEGGGADTFNPFREREGEHPIFSILRRSFDTLLNEDQLLFMDAAIFYPQKFEQEPSGWEEINIFSWLSLVHGKGVNVIKQRLVGLKRKSVVEDLGDGTKDIVMHDLWREFAVMETKNGEVERRRWYYDSYEFDKFDHESNLVDMTFSGGGFNLQRICMTRCIPLHLASVSNQKMKPGYLQSKRRRVETGSSSFPKDELHFSYCTNLTVLKLVKLKLEVLDLNALTQLRSLECHFDAVDSRGEMVVEVRGLKALRNLVVLLLYGIPNYSSWIEEISSLTRLQILRLNWLRNQGFDQQDWNGQDQDSIGMHEAKFPDLRRMWSLQHVSIMRFESISSDTLSGLSNRMANLRILELYQCTFSRCDGVGDLVALDSLTLHACEMLTELPNLLRLTKLRKLSLFNSHRLTALPGFGALVALEELRAEFCSQLDDALDLSNLIHLKVLYLHGCGPVRLLGLDNAVSLREIHVEYSRGLQDSLDLQKLTKLRKVEVHGIYGSTGLPCMSTLPKLEDLCISRCKWGSTKLTYLVNLTSLQSLNISYSDFKEMPCVGGLTTLRKLNIISCERLERLPDIHKLTRLETLGIGSCWNLNVWENLHQSDFEALPLNPRGKVQIDPFLILILKCTGVPISELPASFPHFTTLYLSPPSYAGKWWPRMTFRDLRFRNF